MVRLLPTLALVAGTFAAMIHIDNSTLAFHSRNALFGPALGSGSDTLMGILVSVEDSCVAHSPAREALIYSHLNGFELIHAESSDNREINTKVQRCAQSFGTDPVTHQVRWIALVKRGGCSFAHKVRNMQDMGAAGTIVGDDQDSANLSVLVAMAANEQDASKDLPKIRIPSVFISHKDFVSLERLASSTIDIAPIIVRVIPSSIYYLVGFIVFLMSPISLPLLLAAVDWTFSKYEQYQCACHVRRLKSTQWTRHDDESKVEDDGCSICLEAYAIGDEIRQLPCHHAFHSQCVDRWLTTSVSTCPMCKQAAIAPEFRWRKDELGHLTLFQYFDLY